MRALFIAVVLAMLSPAAWAYPQLQMSRDQTCTGCHLSPAGGGLLNENGLTTAETMSQFGTAPEFMYGVFKLPAWLSLGGDFRGATGLDAHPKKEFVAFPMQADLYAQAAFDAISVHVTAGVRDPQYGNTAKTLFASREHYVMWQQKPGENYGLYVRAGRFMPVFGLRFVEHTAFDRRYGGTPLYGEAYGAAVEYIDPKFELHATGFVHDPFLDSIERGNGGTLYAEARPVETTAVGVEAKLDDTADDRKLHAGVIAKQYLAGPEVLIQGEVQGIHQTIDAGGSANQLVAYVMGTWLHDAFMIDLGAGVYAPDLHVRYLDQEAADLNVHWFATSHLEFVLVNRFQMLEFGAGGLSSGYSLLMAHYRL